MLCNKEFLILGSPLSRGRSIVTPTNPGCSRCSSLFQLQECCVKSDTHKAHNRLLIKLSLFTSVLLFLLRECQSSELNIQSGMQFALSIAGATYVIHQHEQLDIGTYKVLSRTRSVRSFPCWQNKERAFSRNECVRCKLRGFN